MISEVAEPLELQPNVGLAFVGECLVAFAGTELEDVKRLLRGNSSSSVSQSNIVPIPIKTKAESRGVSDSSNTGSAPHFGLSDQYGSVWSGGVSSSSGYSFHNNNNNSNNGPSQLSASSTQFQSGQSQGGSCTTTAGPNVQLHHRLIEWRVVNIQPVYRETLIRGHV